MKQKQFLFWVEALIQGGAVIKHWLVMDCDESIVELLEADSIVEEKIGELRDTHHWDVVINWTVTKIGYDLKTPEEQKKINAQKKTALAIRKEEKDRVVEEKRKKVLFDSILENGVLSDENFYTNYMQRDLDLSKKSKFSNKLKSIIKDKKILFLEGDNVLTSCVGNFYQWFWQNKVDCLTLFNVRSIPQELVLKCINEYDVIVYQSTYTYDESNKLIDYVCSLQESKTVIECYLREPNWFFLPEKAKQHNVYVADCFQDDVEDWEIKKLRLKKATWEK